MAHDCTETEKIYRRMSVIEKQIVGRGGQWVLKKGKWWDEGLTAYVLRCECCKHYFLAKRHDKKTCSESCKKTRQRSNAKANLKPFGEQARF